MASTTVRFSGPPAPALRGQMPSPGQPIVDHLLHTLPALGVKVLKHEDIEYAHELRCEVNARVYSVCVAYDWVREGWWEMFWAPTLGVFRRLLGKSEEQELKHLASAVSQALKSLPGIQEQRWYPSYGASTRARSGFTTEPDT